MNINTTILEALAEYFSGCPLMADGRMKVDYLPGVVIEAGVEYAVASAPSEEIVYSYINGDTRCTYPFVVIKVNGHSPDGPREISDARFAEELSAWMRKQNRSRNLPKLPKGMTPRGIKTLGFEHRYQPDAGAGRYHIKCELEYYRKGD